MRANAEIDLLLARIYSHLGIGDSWAMATERCRPYIRGEIPADQQQLALARFIVGNIRHYRQFAVGKLLPPLKFNADSKILEELLRIGEDEATKDEVRLRVSVMRLRALYTVSSSTWDECLTIPITVTEAISSGIPIEGIDRERLDFFRQVVTEAIALVRETDKVWSRLKKKPQNVPPGGRAAEAEFFFWEAVFLYQSCLLLTANVGRTATQYRPSLDGSSGSWETRLRAHNSLARLLVESVNNSLFSSEMQSDLGDSIFEFRDWIEELLQKSASNVDFRKVRQRLDDLYIEVLNGAVSQATDYFLAADAIYRRLGHKQGHAEVLFQRGLMQFLTGSEPDRTSWHELLMKSNRVTGELGFHLDRLYTHLIFAKVAEASDVFASTSGYQNSMLWCSEMGPGLPEVLRGEINFRLGQQFLVVDEVRGAQENALMVMEEARRRYTPYLDGAPFISEEDAFERMVDIRWHIAELTRRKAARLAQDDKTLRGLLARAEENCNWIINRTKDKPQFSSREMSARVVKASLARFREDFSTIVQELDVAIEYYEHEKDAFWLLQTLFMMCGVILGYEKARESLRDSEVDDYLNRLVRAAMPYARRFEKDHDSLRVDEKSLFWQVCWLLSHVVEPAQAVLWLFNAFDVSTSLGLYGNAILLDDIMRQVLALHNVAEDQKAYKDRLIRASQQIRPRGEEADWQRVGAVLRHYFPVQIPATMHLSQKRDCLRAGVSMMELESMQEAIQALAKGVELIERDNPEDVDFDLLEKLHEAYRVTGSHKKAADVGRQRQELKDIAQSRDFLLLAEKYIEKDWDSKWALEIATKVSFQDSEYYRKARELLEKISALRTAQ